MLGVLPPADAAALEAHVAACGGCAARREALAEEQDTLRAALAARPTPRPALEERIVAALRARPRPARPVTWRSYALAAAAAVLLAATAGALLWRTPSPRQELVQTVRLSEAMALDLDGGGR